MKREEKTPLLKKQGLYTWLRRHWPCLHRIITSKPNEFRCLKALIGVIYGLILGTALHYGVITTMALPEMVRATLGLTLTLALALGCAVSVQVRAISTLVLPTITGKNGRSYVWAFIIATLLGGPIANIMTNAGEVSRSLSCSAKLAHNQTRDRMTLMFKPVSDIMKELQGQAVDIHDVTAEVEHMFQPVVFEVSDESEVAELQKTISDVDKEEGMDRSSRIENRHKVGANKSPGQASEDKFERKLDYRCEEVFSLGVIQCKQVFAQKYEECLNTIKVIGSVMCLPLKLDVICNLAKIVPQLAGLNCNSMEAVNPGFGDSYETARKSTDDLDKNFKVNMQYEVVEGQQALQRKTAKDVTLAVAHEFKSRRSYFDRVVSFLNKILAFLFFRVIFSAFSYHRKYVTDFHFDNIYINNYFHWIDARRRLMGGRRLLLPLRSLEKKEVMKSGRLSLTGPEKSKLVRGTIGLLVRAFTFVMVVVVDQLIFEILDLVRRHSQIDYRQSGSHHIGIVIHGSGAMGQLLRSMLGGFNKKHSIDSFSSNAECLPRPTATPIGDINRLGGLLALVWILMLIESYGLRLRHVVAGFFYPRRAKRRTLFLYNDMLKKRKGYLKHARQLVRNQAREQTLTAKMSILATLRYKFPSLCGCLRACGKKNCLVCQEPENASFVQCRCKFVYCSECWTDIQQRCYACGDTRDLDSDSDEELIREINAAREFPQQYDDNWQQVEVNEPPPYYADSWHDLAASEPPPQYQDSWHELPGNEHSLKYEDSCEELTNRQPPPLYDEDFGNFASDPSASHHRGASQTKIEHRSNVDGSVDCDFFNRDRPPNSSDFLNTVWPSSKIHDG